MKTIAIICDCDNTLMPDLPSLLLKDNGMEPQDFWDEIDVLVKDGWDPPIAWMTKLIKLIQDGKIKQNTNEKLAEFGASIDIYHGADTFIDELNSTLENVTVEGYVVSSGIESMMKGSKIANSFTDIFGGRLYEKDGIIAGIKSSITLTEKTKFVFAINKGITSQIREKPYDVNNFIPISERRVPFENMIYLGDGPSDIPCFSMIQQKGGHSIAIDSKDEWSKNWEYELRRRKIDSFKPDYTKNSDLYKKLETIIQN
ncbi:MAG: hypothetical protein O3C48_08280 [Crenarchaeota archaeon]|nr:hypothetical protein [Thermoproteota archaeon]